MPVAREEAVVRIVVFPEEEGDSVVLVGMLDAGQEVCVAVPEVAVGAVPAKFSEQQLKRIKQKHGARVP